MTIDNVSFDAVLMINCQNYALQKKKTVVYINISGFSMYCLKCFNQVAPTAPSTTR